MFGKPKAAKWHRLSADLSTPDLLMQEKYKAHVHKLREEFTKMKQPKSMTVKKLLDITFSYRQRWITGDVPHISEVVEKFPFFHHERWV